MMTVPYKKRTPGYLDFRKIQWQSRQAVLDTGTKFSSHGSEWVDADGTRIQLTATEYVLVPKPVLFFKDEWHCGSVDMACALARHLLKFSEITDLQLKGRWLWVMFSGNDHLLPGQLVKDSRGQVTVYGAEGKR
jgi:hypothetical protein